MPKELNVILTGATGMIGEGVLYHCLNNNDVKKVLVINRKPSGYKHSKLKEIIHEDFLDLIKITDHLEGYNSCFFCLGTTAVGKSEDEYRKFTYDLTLNFAKILANKNDQMTFCYVSGSGTNSNEKGNMWSRVKGKTENDLMKLDFKNVFCFRPAGILPFLPLKPTQTYYKTYRYTSWLFPAIKKLEPNYVNKLEDLSAVMIHVSQIGHDKNILEAKDINHIAQSIHLKYKE